MTVFADCRRWADVPELSQPGPVGTGAAPTFAEVRPSQRWNRFGISFFLHAGLLLVLIKIAVWLPSESAQVVTHSYEPVALVAPTLEKRITLKPLPAPPPKVMAQIRNQPPVFPAVIVPRIEKTVVKSVSVPEAPKFVANNVPPELPKLPVPKKIMEGLFDAGSSAKPASKAAVHEVETGEFTIAAAGASKPNIDRKLASAGSFDLPAGSENAGSSKSKQAVVASTGFADQAPRSNSGERSVRSAVTTVGFSEVATVEVTSKHARVSDTTPVEILFKPKPVYTAEARQLHIEGEVLLDVRFAASGDARVLRVVRGLGHGLDEAAETAGQKIRFEPAKRDGRPYDSDALVHIVFQLAE